MQAVMKAGYAAALAGGLLLGCGPASADKIKNPTAVFNGLDKITGRIVSFEVAVDETVQFGALQITPRVCYTRPPTEGPQTDAFLEVDEVTQENKYRRIFSGWMFAASPGLNAVEHSIYDVWLTDCKGGSAIIADNKDKDAPAPTAGAQGGRGAPAGGARTARRNSQGQLDVDAPRGVEVRPSQAPSRRFYPTNDPSGR